MKRILCLGDSITDMNRSRTHSDELPYSLGTGYAFLLANELGKLFPNRFEIINRGVSGERSVDVYARVK